MIDLNQLSTPISAESPCGFDLEDDAICSSHAAARAQQSALLNLDALFSEARRANVDDDIWITIFNEATELLKFNKHLRVADYLYQAATRRHHLIGLTRSLELIRKLCEDWWDEVHPLDSTPGGKKSRVNILSGIASNSFIAALRKMPFVEGAPGATLEAYERACATGNTDDEASLRDFAHAELGDNLRSKLDEALRFAEEAIIHARWISEWVDSQYTSDSEVGCGELITAIDGKLLKKIGTIRRILVYATKIPPVALPTISDVAARTPFVPAAHSGGFAKEHIRPMLDQIIDYYREHEPSSPVPLLLRRAKRLMDLNFLDLVKDTAGDDAVRHAQQILGTDKEEAK